MGTFLARKNEIKITRVRQPSGSPRLTRRAESLATATTQPRIAVSLAVADSKLRTGAAPSANITVVRMATNILGMVKHRFFSELFADDRDPFKARKRP